MFKVKSHAQNTGATQVRVHTIVNALRLTCLLLFSPARLAQLGLSFSSPVNDTGGEVPSAVAVRGCSMATAILILLSPIASATM